MSTEHINIPERETQTKVISFFKEELHYSYLGNLHDVANKNIREKDLFAFLVGKQRYSETVANKAIAELKHAAGDLQQGLYSANKTVYNLLKYSHPVPDLDGENVSVYYIDFENPANNNFAIAEEVTVNTTYGSKRPDLVVYINGIAVAVIELKKSSVSVADGIRQNLTNQKPEFIESFFTTIQFCLAANTSEGVRYGTIATPEKKYLTWKQEAFRERLQELDENDLIIDEKSSTFSEDLFESLYSLFNKIRFLDLIHNFIIFDNGKKKVCRYNQYYAIHRTYNRIQGQKKGGIVWHTQGSGKSLTMVWLAKRLLLNNPSRRILIVTDRDELDDQIEQLFKGVEEKIIRTKSGRDLLNRLNSTEGTIICSLVHKFGRRGGEVSDDDYEKFLKEIRDSLPPNFSVKGDFVVFVDECHRTQSGKLHKAMTALMPKAIFVGFTGTPLLKKDKKTSLEVFGSYIHTYKFDEGVRDHVILDLRYEGRDVPQELKSHKRIDEWFELKTKGMTPIAKTKLKARWANIRTVYSSYERLKAIACDVIFDFEKDARLADGRGNAILVADSIYTACRFYEIFQSMGFKKCAIISSYTPNSGDLRTDTVSLDEETETFRKYQIYLKMVGIEEGDDTSRIDKKVEAFEKEAKRKFVEEPANMKLLIVVDKLLTGFDAPSCTYLYIDKKMQDHGLFQAICRVNRLDDDTKLFGVIIDYKELFENVTDSMHKYTSGAFEGYDDNDVDGLIKDRTAEAEKYFNKTLEEIETLCEDVKPPKDEADYIHFFCGENISWINDPEESEALARLRERFYLLASRLVRAFAELKSQISSLPYTEAEWTEKEKRTNDYVNLRQAIMQASGDFVDLKACEPDMRHLIDNYIAAGDSTKIVELDDTTLLDIIELFKFDLTTGKKKVRESAAEKIENNIRRKIVDQININPAYYNKMSEILDQLIEERKNGLIEYQQLLERYIELAKKVNASDLGEDYPSSIKGCSAKRAIYDNCGKNEDLANSIYEAVMDSMQADFRSSPVKINRIKRALFKVLQDTVEVDRVYELISKQSEF
jgi:type I restriction enzyme R subunit